MKLLDRCLIEHADAIEWLKDLPENSVDLAIVDPPYNISFDGGAGWDSQWKSESDYLAWCAEWTELLVRALKPGATLCVWGTLKTDTFLKYKLDVLNELDLIDRGEIIWSYNWGGRTTKDFARKHEYVWVYCKSGAEPIFNADDVRVERKVKNNPRTGEAYDKGTIPTRVWEKNNHTMSKGFVNWHPTTKNVELLERLIRAYSNPGDLVIDCFSGSGSTAVAAVQSGRRFHGCEIDKDYLERSLVRINECVQVS